ncbi:MAG TPA: TetR/AcrR family transcriptional regulator [Solirubrobacterales bacterium]|jgi:AcrR family transcriptional regulator
MVITPWGESERLRDRRLPPGRGVPRAEARKNQRERLLAAMVASCEARGYEATAVADLLEISGVSRATFYEHFEDKVSCFAAAVEEVLGAAILVISQRLEGEGSAERRGRAALETFVDLMVAQPAAARMCLVQAYAAGEPGVAPMRRTVDEVARLGREVLEQMPGRKDMPEELVRAIIGAFYRVIYDRLQSGREAELPGLVPGLWDWAMGYPPPSQPLRLTGRRGQVPVEGSMPPFAAYDPEQRIIRAFARAVAAKGYGATTISDVAAAASISQTTYYVYFHDKADAMAAALDSSGAQMLAAALPPARRALDWPSAVRAALRASCGFLASEPDFARLRMVEVYAAGPQAIAQRDTAGLQFLGPLLGPAFEDSPKVPKIVVEAIVGAIYSSVYDHVRAGPVETLPEIAPLLTYLALAPFLGAEQACEVANGDARSPRPRLTP